MRTKQYDQFRLGCRRNNTFNSTIFLPSKQSISIVQLEKKNTHKTQKCDPHGSNPADTRSTFPPKSRHTFRTSLGLRRPTNEHQGRDVRTCSRRVTLCSHTVCGVDRVSRKCPNWSDTRDRRQSTNHTTNPHYQFIIGWCWWRSPNSVLWRQSVITSIGLEKNKSPSGVFTYFESMPPHTIPKLI